MLVKRSISLAGHRTSIALEQAFWDELDRIAAHRSVSRAALIAKVDAAREPESNLASALRLLVLDNLKKRQT
jgi:predicted DNA-binding ribbon-helix-helix protein